MRFLLSFWSWSCFQALREVLSVLLACSYSMWCSEGTKSIRTVVSEIYEQKVELLGKRIYCCLFCSFRCNLCAHISLVQTTVMKWPKQPRKLRWSQHRSKPRNRQRQKNENTFKIASVMPNVRSLIWVLFSRSLCSCDSASPVRSLSTLFWKLSWLRPTCIFCAHLPWKMWPW